MPTVVVMYEWTFYCQNYKHKDLIFFTFDDSISFFCTLKHHQKDLVKQTTEDESLRDQNTGPEPDCGIFSFLFKVAKVGGEEFFCFQ